MSVRQFAGRINFKLVACQCLPMRNLSGGGGGVGPMHLQPAGYDIIDQTKRFEHHHCPGSSDAGENRKRFLAHSMPSPLADAHQDPNPSWRWQWHQLRLDDDSFTIRHYDSLLATVLVLRNNWCRSHSSCRLFQDSSGFLKGLCRMAGKGFCVIRAALYEILWGSRRVSCCEFNRWLIVLIQDSVFRV